MAGKYSIEAVFKAVDRVTGPVNRMQRSVGMMTRRMSAHVDILDKRLDRFSASAKRGAAAVVAATAISAAALTGVVSTGAQFEQTLVAAAAKFPGEIQRGTEAFSRLEEAARRTGATTEYSASQSAEALNFLAMAGFDADASIAALPGVVDLATAAQVDLATATDVASDSLGAFGLMTKDASQLGKNLARVNDVIARTTTSANTTVEALFETIKEGAPVATTAGASIETFAALAGELANAGIKGSQAGTTLKNVFLTLSAPTAGAAKLLQRLGIQTQDANGDLRDVVDILGDLNGSLDGLGTAERSGVLEGIFGKIPIAGVNVLLASGSDKLREYRKTLEGASGAASKMAATMRDTVQGRINSLKSAVEGVSISLFSMTSGPLADVIDSTTEWVRANEKLIATNVGGFITGILSNMAAIVTWGKRIGIAVAVFLALTTALKTLVLVMTAVNLVMAANPIVLITLGIIALVAAIAALVYWWGDLMAAFKSAGPIVDGILAGLILLGGPIGWLIGAAGLIYRYWEPIKEFFADLWSGIVSSFDAAIAHIQAIIADITGGIASAMETVSGFGSRIAGFFGGGSAAAGGDGATGPQVVSPQERVARNIQETTTTTKAEVTIRDDTGRAELTGGALGPGLTLASTGAF